MAENVLADLSPDSLVQSNPLEGLSADSFLEKHQSDMLTPRYAKNFPQEAANAFVQKKATEIERAYNNPSSVEGARMKVREEQGQPAYDPEQIHGEFQKLFPGHNDPEELTQRIEQTREVVRPQAKLAGAYESAKRQVSEDWQSPSLGQASVGRALMGKLPFVRHAFAIADPMRANAAASRIEQGTATDADYQTVGRHLAEQEVEAKKTRAFRFAEGALSAGAFAAELAPLSGLAGKAGEEAGGYLLARLGGQNAGALGRVGATLGGQAAQTGVLVAGQPLSLAEGTIRRASDKFTVGSSDAGMYVITKDTPGIPQELRQELTGDKRLEVAGIPVAALGKAFADETIQMATMGSMLKGAELLKAMGPQASPFIQAVLQSKVAQAVSRIPGKGLAQTVVGGSQLPGVFDMRLAELISGATGVRDDYGTLGMAFSKDPQQRERAREQIVDEAIVLAGLHGVTHPREVAEATARISQRVREMGGRMGEAAGKGMNPMYGAAGRETFGQAVESRNIADFESAMAKERDYVPLKDSSPKSIEEEASHYRRDLASEPPGDAQRMEKGLPALLARNRLVADRNEAQVGPEGMKVAAALDAVGEAFNRNKPLSDAQARFVEQVLSEQHGPEQADNKRILSRAWMDYQEYYRPEAKSSVEDMLAQLQGRQPEARTDAPMTPEEAGAALDREQARLASLPPNARDLGLGKPAPEAPAGAAKKSGPVYSILSKFGSVRLHPGETSDYVMRIGDRELTVDHDQERNAVRLDFGWGNENKAAALGERGGVAGEVQKGSIAFARKLRDIAHAFAKEGMGLEYVAADERRDDVYSKLLPSAGYQEVKGFKSDSGEDIRLWRPTAPPASPEPQASPVAAKATESPPTGQPAAIRATFAKHFGEGVKGKRSLEVGAGERKVSVEVDADDQGPVAHIAFGYEGQENPVKIGKKAPSAETIGFGRKLLDFVKDLGDQGIRVSYQAEPKRAKTYENLLRRAGFEPHEQKATEEAGAYPYETWKPKVQPQSVWERMPEAELSRMAKNGVEGAKAELNRRAALEGPAKTEEVGGKPPIPETVLGHIAEIVGKGDAKDAHILRTVMKESGILDEAEIDKAFRKAGAKLSDEGEPLPGEGRGSQAHPRWEQARNYIPGWLQAEVDADAARRAAESDPATSPLAAKIVQGGERSGIREEADDAAHGDTSFPFGANQPRTEPGDAGRSPLTPEQSSELARLIAEQKAEIEIEKRGKGINKSLTGAPGKGISKAPLEADLSRIDAAENLTAEEKAILKGIAQGQSLAQIGKAEGLKGGSVAWRRDKALEKHPELADLLGSKEERGAREGVLREKVAGERVESREPWEIASEKEEGQVADFALPVSGTPTPTLANQPTKGLSPEARRQGIIDNLRHLLAPATRGEVAEQVSGNLRENLSILARKSDIAADYLYAAKAHFDEWVVGQKDPAVRQDRFLQFADAIEGAKDANGRPVIESLPDDLRSFAEALRHVTDERTDQLRQKGLLKTFVENYFGHIWKQGEGDNGSAVGRQFARRPLAGSESFRRKRSIPTYREGIEGWTDPATGEHVSFEPASWNPIELALMKIREMDKSIMGHDAFNEFDEKGQVKYVRNGAKPPAGWRSPDDKFFTVFAPSRIPLTEFYDKAQWDALEGVAKNLGVDLNRIARPGQTWAGKADSQGITTAFGSPEEVLAHELGHKIDKQFDLGQRMKPFENELIELAKERHATGTPPPGFEDYVKTPKEQIANLVAAYIHAPDLLQKVAPNAASAFVQFLHATPEVRGLLDAKPSLALARRTQEMQLAGPMRVGKYYMPNEAADLLDNYLLPGLQGHPVYDAARATGNLLNQFQLGFGFFHAGFEIVDAQFSSLALAFRKVAVGDLPGSIKNFVGGTIPFVAAFQNLVEGNKMLREWYSPGSQGAETAALVNALNQAGGRARMDAFYGGDQWEKLKTAVRTGDPKTALGRAILALPEVFSKPVMEHMVPRMKMGAFAQIARFELSRLGDQATPEQARSVLGRAWDSVENRLGQMTYDNLFWNRTFKDALMLGVRSVGWNLGTVRELFGGVADIPSSLKGLAKGEGISNRLAYLAALPIGTAILGAMFQTLMTGKGPDELKDYLFPRTGGTKPDGTPERVSLPSYMKDMAQMVNRADEGPMRIAQNLWTMAKHKVHPLATALGEMLDNEDFYGTAIRNPNDSATRQALDTAFHAIKSFEPFSVRNWKDGAGKGVQAFFGITPAPAYITRTWEQQREMETERKVTVTPLEKKRKAENPEPAKKGKARR